MAQVVKTLDGATVTGERGTLVILGSLDDTNGALYRVYHEDEDGDDTGHLYISACLDDAIDWAEYEVDGMNDEPDDGMTDVEADADTLASAGYGTDEDYGVFSGDD